MSEWSHCLLEIEKSRSSKDVGGDFLVILVSLDDAVCELVLPHFPQCFLQGLDAVFVLGVGRVGSPHHHARLDHLCLCRVGVVADEAVVALVVDDVDDGGGGEVEQHGER